MNDLAKLIDAIAFAAAKHRDGRRKDAAASPYINHPIALAHLLATQGGIDDVVVLQAAILHDTIEDTETSREELADRFGDKVASVVVEVTDDKKLSPSRRKELQVEHAASNSHEATLVKLADKICNLTDIAKTPPADWTLERKREYYDWARRVVERLPPANAALKSAFDAAYQKRP